MESLDGISFGGIRKTLEPYRNELHRYRDSPVCYGAVTPAYVSTYNSTIWQFPIYDVSEWCPYGDRTREQITERSDTRVTLLSTFLSSAGKFWMSIWPREEVSK